MISHTIAAPIDGTPLRTDELDRSRVSRQPVSNLEPLHRHYRDVRTPIVDALTYKRTWGVLYDVSDVFLYVPPNHIQMALTVLS